MPQLPTCKMQLDYVHVDTLHIYVHMQLNYVGMQNTGTYVAFWKNLSYESWEGQTYPNSWPAKNTKNMKDGTYVGWG